MAIPKKPGTERPLAIYLIYPCDHRFFDGGCGHIIAPRLLAHRINLYAALMPIFCTSVASGNLGALCFGLPFIYALFDDKEVVLEGAGHNGLAQRGDFQEGVKALLD